RASSSGCGRRRSRPVATRIKRSRSGAGSLERGGAAETRKMAGEEQGIGVAPPLWRQVMGDDRPASPTDAEKATSWRAVLRVCLVHSLLFAGGFAAWWWLT